VICIFLEIAARALPQTHHERWRLHMTDWRQDTFARTAFARRLERTGREVRRLVPKLAPWWGNLRPLMRDRADRIAAGFQAHALAVTLGGSERDERTVESLVAGFVAACTDDWEALTQADPRPLRRRAMLAWIRGGAIAGACVAASLVLPPLLVDTPQARQQMVLTLLGAALVALASPKDALSRVADHVTTLGKRSGGQP